MDILDFSLVTTCRNEIRSFDRWKQNVMEQTRPPSEIVIVDAFSDDGTAENLYEWASCDPRVKIFQEKGAAAHGRNIAIGNSKFEIVLSTDMGVRLSPVWCEELIKPFENDPTVEVVAGNTCIDIETIKSAAARAEYYFEDGGFANFKDDFIIGNRSSAYRKRVWAELNGLPEDLTFYADDSVFGRQIAEKGYKMAFASDAITYWARPQSLNQFCREQYVYGKGDGEALIKTPKAFKWYHKKLLPRQLVPAIHSIIQMVKPSFFQGLARALKKKDLIAALFITLLISGRGFSYAKGYIEGFYSGNKNCNGCRARLTRDSNGYSIV